MNNLKKGTFLIILGNILYLAYIKFCSDNTNSDFGNFSSGFLLGISIACNLIGLIILIRYIVINKEKKDKDNEEK